MSVQVNGQVRRLFDVPIHALTMDQVLARVADTVRNGQRMLIGVVNAAKLVYMRSNGVLRESVLDADVILADGMAVVWASRLLGLALPERIAGIDLMHAMLGQACEMGHRVYCLGATEEVLESAIAQMRADHPGLIIAGWHHGYFDEDEEGDIADQIGLARADILFVAMTSPKKERFLARWFAQMNVAVCHGVGGSFDVLAGKVRRAPRLWQRLGIEWLYRVIQEPRRMWRRYLVTNTVFCGMVLAAMFGQQRRGRSSSS